MTAKLNPRLSAEVDKTIKSELPDCKDWTPLPIFEVLLRIVAIVSGNVFVGPENCRHEIYLDSAINYTNLCTLAPQQLKRYPKWMRSLVIRLGLVPAVQGSRDHRERLRTLLEPLVKERRQLIKEGKPVPEDILQWMVEKTSAHDIHEMEHLVQMQLLLTMAAIHTTTASATGM